MHDNNLHNQLVTAGEPFYMLVNIKFCGLYFKPMGSRVSRQ